MYARGGGTPGPAWDDAVVTAHRLLLFAALLAGGALGFAATACTDGGGTPTTSAACGPIVREPLDPAYVVHPVGSSVKLVYLTDPPTSGPHQAGPGVHGIADAPLTKPVQVGILERGDVLVQHHPGITSEQRITLEALAGDGVVVAPNVDLPAPIVATAWTHKRSCQFVDVRAIKEFISERRGKGPEG